MPNVPMRSAASLRRHTHRRPLPEPLAELAAELGLSQATALPLDKAVSQRRTGTRPWWIASEEGLRGIAPWMGNGKTVIRATIKVHYLNRNRPTVSQLVRGRAHKLHLGRFQTTRPSPHDSGPASGISDLEKRA